MPKQIYHYFKKSYFIKNYILHFFITLLVGGGIFGVIQSINAASLTEIGIEGTNTQVTNSGDYITRNNYISMNFSGSSILYFFQRSWNGIPTIFYDTGATSNTIYFNNFDTPEVLEENKVPLADSIRDFPDEDFLGGTIGTGNNGWKYLYKYNSGITNTIVNYEWENELDGTPCTHIMPLHFIPNTVIPAILPAPGDGLTIIQTGCYELQGYPPMPSGWELDRLNNHLCDDYQVDLITRTCTSIETTIPNSISEYFLKGLKYNSGTNLRTIGTDPIINYNFANIGKKYAHPGSGTNIYLSELSGQNNIRVVRQRTSNLSGKVKIINKIQDDDNNCGNGIIYKIYTGYINEQDILTGFNRIKQHYLPNLSGTTIERSGDITIGQNIFFEIDNSGDNQCDGTWNRIQIYDITNNTGVSGGPSYTYQGKYGGALAFTGNQLFSLGTGINQSTTNGITIAAWVKTNNNTQSQGIITKKFSYGIVLKNGTIRISPSTYWMRHDTTMTIPNNTRTHVARTYDGNTMRAYKNGSQIRTYNINGTLATNDELAMIGYDDLNKRGRNGSIDEFRMYQTAFSTGQIKELYESNLKIVDSGANSSWNFIINKTNLIDGIYNYGTKRYNISNPELTGSIIIDTKGPMLTGITGLTVYESQPLIITGIWYDTGMSGYITTGFDRGYSRNLNGPRDIGTNTGNIVNLGIENEPTQKEIKIRIIDHIGNTSYRTGSIVRANTGPVINDSKNLYTGIVEDDITFIASGYDTGSNLLYYQWYNGLNCNGLQIITGETNQTYITGSQVTYTGNFSYKIFDSQGSGSTCWDITGIRSEPSTNNINLIGNTGGYLNGRNDRLIDNNIFINGNILKDGNIGTCIIDNNEVQYIGTGIGNDFCIVHTLTSGDIVLGRYGVNRYNTLYSLTGAKINPYLISESKPPFIIEFQNTNLTGFNRSISGINNNINFTKQIYSTGLIGLYNFDKVLLTDSEEDFSAIQGGKNWTYMRRPKGTGEYTGLQYYASSKQWIISTPIGDYDGFFIEKDELNPGYNYGDAVLGRTSPVNASIEIQYSLTDANTNLNCGDGIRYKLLKNTDILATGFFGTNTITTGINKGDIIYLVINSINDNDCDNTNYNIKIYQLPETNLAINTIPQSRNSGASYGSGKYYGALDFTNNKYVSIGTGIQSGNMSISARIYKGSGDNQTIIQKRGSYGIVLYNNQLQVTNQNTTRRYNTQITIPNNIRTHIGRSYNGTIMRVYINGKEQRSGSVLGTIPSNNNSTYIGYSFSNGGRTGLIDEVYIYNYAIDSGVFATLYDHNLNKVARDKRTWTSNQSGAVYNGHYDFTGTVNNNGITGWEFIRDFTPPLFTGIIGLTGFESDILTITGFGYDSGSSISGYQFRYNLTGNRSERSNQTGYNTFIISGQNEPITGSIEIKAQDIFGYETLWTGVIEWVNKGPVINGNTEFYGNVGQNISFIASGYDIGGEPLTYQWYLNTGCTNIITNQTGSIFTTGSNFSGIINFSYNIFDKQGSGSCANITGIWDEDTMFINNTKYFNGDGNGGIISGEIFPPGVQIIENAKYGECLLTGNSKEILNYIPNTGSKENDSCIIELIHGIYTVAAFTNINNNFIYSRIPEIIGITKDIRDISRTSKISTPTITSFTGKRSGQTFQLSGIGINNISINTNNLIRKYNFDTIEITDSSEDFGYFQGQNGRKYLWDNGTTGGELVFNPITKNRIINEPLQDYEYIFINNLTAYPGATKYGNIIYERTSNITGNINIDTIISNANNPSCGSSNGINYKIEKGATSIYTNYISNLTETSGTGTYIQSGDKLKFTIDGNGDNQCDKINFNVKIYQNSTNDYSSSGQNLINFGAASDNNGKFYGAYTFGPATGKYLNIGNIKKDKDITFSTRIKTTSTTNQTLIYKQGSYGLTIKDGLLKITTDGGRRYPTNTNTTNILTNGSRNHLVRTYNGTNMYIYLNGYQTRSGRIVGYYPLNDNPTIIGRNNNHGQFNGSLDEFQVRNKTLTNNEIQNLYNTQFSKLDDKTREFSLIQTGLADGIYTFTGYINNTNIITGTTIIDNDAPIIMIDSLYTGNEATGIIINITGWDNGIGIISGYEYSWTVNNSDPTNLASGITGWITDTTIIIPAQNEPTTGILTIKAKDSLGHQTGKNTIIQRLNLPITTAPLSKTAFETENITFNASGFDPNGTTNTGYQWYSGNNCLIVLTGINLSGFTTGFNEPGIRVFSYNMFDKQGLTGSCSIATGERTNIEPIAKDLYINASGAVDITFTATGSDPGGTEFSYQRYLGTGCEYIVNNQTGQTFTTGSEKSGTRTFSYRSRDAQGATGKNNINTGRDCQIATGYRPYINPVANDFDISLNTANKLVTGDRRALSNARDPEFNTIIIANISSGSKGYCQVTNDRVSFQPMTNQTGAGFCELTLTDGNNRSTKINAYALNIDTTPPVTTITGQNYTSFTLQYDDTSIATSYYKILIGVWNVSSCGTSGYNTYTSQVSISYTPDIIDYRTVCYYSQDTHGNTENIKSQLFTQPQDATPFNVSSFADTFVNNIFEATITTNKACTGILTGLAQNKSLSLTPGTHTITGSFTETNGSKTAFITLQTNNTEELFTRSHTFTIDQVSPSTPVITENTENNDYYIIKRNSSTDDISGIKGYNYEISNQYTTVKSGFTDVTYLNILKSEVQYNSQITIKVQARDNVNNLSSRSNSRSITIVQQETPTTIDTIPNQFSFTKTTNAKIDTLYTSNEIIIGGLSTNTSIPIKLFAGNLFINDTKITDNSGSVKNGDIVYIQLYSSDIYNDATQATLIANGVSSTYTITTDTKTYGTTSFLDELKKLLEQLQKEDNTTTNTTNTIDINIDTTRISAPHTAPNGKVYNLYKTLDGRYSSSNFIIKKYFTSLSEIKLYIDKNNPR